MPTTAAAAIRSSNGNDIANSGDALMLTLFILSTLQKSNNMKLERRRHLRYWTGRIQSITVDGQPMARRRKNSTNDSFVFICFHLSELRETR
mgnify:CR=1 FL=1